VSRVDLFLTFDNERFNFSLDSRSIFLMDCGTLIMIYVGLNVPPDVLEAVLGMILKPNQFVLLICF